MDDDRLIIGFDEEGFIKAIQSSDRRTQLEAMRDKIAFELVVDRCRNCEALRMRAGEVSSIMLRLQKILEELDELPDAKDEDAPKTGLEALREQTNVTPFDRKRAPRQQSTRTRDKSREA